MEIIYVVLSSAAVSGLVTLLTGQYFNHQRFLQKQKLELYMQFLEKTDNLFDGQIFEHGKGREEMHRRMANASGEVHQLSWKIQLISRNPKITKYASDIAQKYDKLSDNDFVAEMVAKEDFSPAWEVVDQINSLTDQFLIEASRELKRWF